MRRFQIFSVCLCLSLLCACQVTPASSPAPMPEASALILDSASLSCTNGPTCMYVSENYFSYAEYESYEAWIYFFFSLQAAPSLPDKDVSAVLGEKVTAITLYDAQGAALASFPREDLSWVSSASDNVRNITLHVTVRDAQAFLAGSEVDVLSLALSDGSELSFPLTDYILCAAPTDARYPVSSSPIFVSLWPVDGGYEASLSYEIALDEGAPSIVSARLVTPDTPASWFTLRSDPVDDAPESIQPESSDDRPTTRVQYTLFFPGEPEQLFLRPLLELTLEDGSGVNTLPAIPVMIDVIYAEQDSAEPIDASQGL